MPLLHDPTRSSDNARYWQGAMCLYKDKVAVIVDVGTDYVQVDPNGNSEERVTVPLNSEHLSVQPVVAQYHKGNLMYNKAERRAQKGYSGASSQLYRLKAADVAVAGDVTKRTSDGDVQLYGIYVANMTQSEYTAYKERFVCI